MTQSDKEIIMLELGAVVQELYRSATLEGKTFEDSEYNHGRTAAYKLVYDILQKVSDLNRREFDRKIDELKAAKTLNLRGKPDGKYAIYFVDGRITTEFPSSSDSKEKQK